MGTNNSESIPDYEKVYLKGIPYIPTNDPRAHSGKFCKEINLGLQPSLAFGPPGESCRIKGAHALIAGGDKGAST